MQDKSKNLRAEQPFEPHALAFPASAIFSAAYYAQTQRINKTVLEQRTGDTPTDTIWKTRKMPCARSTEGYENDAS